MDYNITRDCSSQAMMPQHMDTDLMSVNTFSEPTYWNRLQTIQPTLWNSKKVPERSPQEPPSEFKHLKCNLDHIEQFKLNEEEPVDTKMTSDVCPDTLGMQVIIRLEITRMSVLKFPSSALEDKMKKTLYLEPVTNRDELKDAFKYKKAIRRALLSFHEDLEDQNIQRRHQLHPNPH
ncbi:hypothetical protein RF11_15105 [Thelohanellus kitauei]|uniref:Uncharacterized protein n=1 Tax=Thelohanellus kitauei TaxID=669202 RepID=A0A0C2MUK6_THEKT|nr:hypothetical protein RF11_15105 [Thelohanellus kitauei]